MSSVSGSTPSNLSTIRDGFKPDQDDTSFDLSRIYYRSKHSKRLEEESSSSSSSQPLTFEERLLDSKDYCLHAFLQMLRQNDFFLPELKNEYNLYIREPNEWSDDLHEKFNLIYTFIINEKFREFFEKLVKLLVEINSSNVTLSVNDECYKKIDELFHILVANGFDGPDFKKLSFWSGKQVKEFLLKNRYQTDKLVDLQIPAYIALFALGNLLDEDEYLLKNPCILFRRLVCLHIANQARGDVSVYLSKDGILTEDFLRVGNHFWEFELPVLRQLQLKGVVKKINFIFFTNDYKTDFWAVPIDMDSEDANKLKLVPIVPVESEIVVKGKKIKKVDYKPDVRGKEITLGKLRDIIDRWRKIAQDKALERIKFEETFEKIAP